MSEILNLIAREIDRPCRNIKEIRCDECGTPTMHRLFDGDIAECGRCGKEQKLNGEIN